MVRYRQPVECETQIGCGRIINDHEMYGKVGVQKTDGGVPDDLWMVFIDYH
jgi:hypothetical protein